MVITEKGQKCRIDSYGDLKKKVKCVHLNFFSCCRLSYKKNQRLFDSLKCKEFEVHLPYKKDAEKIKIVTYHTCYKSANLLGDLYNMLFSTLVSPVLESNFSLMYEYYVLFIKWIAIYLLALWSLSRA